MYENQPLDNCICRSDTADRLRRLCRQQLSARGRYNDYVWTLQTADGQASRETSVRFLVWLDYMYSTEDIDVIRRRCPPFPSYTF
ncbi:MAG: hypothetical protein IJ746_06530 [Ruminococcus sp.]|nr:hypothetical protein [Ruminococcus sp.]